MKIAFISSWFSENMGYSENLFPKAFAAMGHEVHLVTSTAQVYYKSANYKEVYEPFLGPATLEPGVKRLDSYTLHRLPHSEVRGLGIEGLGQCLVGLRPDILQVFEINEPATYEAACVSKQHGPKLFTESHIHASVFRKNNIKTFRERRRSLKNFFRPTLRRINQQTVLCYPIAPDAAEIARSYFHVPPAKIKVQSLGVDTDLFAPVATAAARQARRELRHELGFAEHEIVCIYTGRFTQDKNPHCLAQAIDHLTRRQEPYRGLFVGQGTPEDQQELSSMKGCLVHPFVPVNRLRDFYRAADIGVWPREESTSQLDAAACGLPIILSNRAQVPERVEGNGLVYEENAPDDLADKLLALKEESVRRKMGDCGANKMLKHYSWASVAKARLLDYEASLKTA